MTEKNDSISEQMFSFFQIIIDLDCVKCTMQVFDLIHWVCEIIYVRTSWALFLICLEKVFFSNLSDILYNQSVILHDQFF